MQRRENERLTKTNFFQLVSARAIAEEAIATNFLLQLQLLVYFIEHVPLPSSSPQ